MLECSSEAPYLLPSWATTEVEVLLVHLLSLPGLVSVGPPHGLLTFVVLSAGAMCDGARVHGGSAARRRDC